ncbi:zincin [Delitschia confertaspora ATCC 74209]|uniref:Zincin n=1 Tax=Delitschia confertaspora ATCC 74209 TaxID=1513339 RepID=A0A9P4JDF0_9PLEO|nr:zincin [Delitschia confertaspora ATCC 74209]
MKLIQTPFVSLLIITRVIASNPTNILPSSSWHAEEYGIHKSCNATQALQLRRGLNEMVLLVEQAKSHILQHGNSSALYRKYFGDEASAEPAGWYDRVANANRSEVLFRCDDPDKNCVTQEGWAGHWRGSNATQETVICPLSFETRRPLEAMCAFGYNVADSPTNFYFASDLLHRVFHIPQISLGTVEHFTENYAKVLELAKKDSSLSVRDSDALTYFALEVFSYVVFPGEGCPGMSVHSTTAANASVTASQTSSATTACHTHDDGAVHC